MITRTLHAGLGLALVAAPGLVGAQGAADSTVNLNFFDDALGQIANLINQLVPLLIALALVFFLWGVVTFILAAGDEDARSAGKSKMFWGIIALFVIVSVWGLVGLLNEITGVDQGGGFDQPETGL
jgi:hypothetical protein